MESFLKTVFSGEFSTGVPLKFEKGNWKMKLSEIVSYLSQKGLVVENPCSDVEIAHISCDSRDVKANTLFFVKGVAFKPEYLLSAVENGAVAYVSEFDLGVDIPFVKVSDVRKAMPYGAKFFYGDPVSRYKLAAVTGTKGKTSLVYMLRSIFEKAFGAEKYGYISTNGAMCGTQPLKKSGTTPEALELYGILNKFALENISAAAMEVSSQALKYDRVEGIRFHTGVFLTLSNDHISPTEHSSFEDYKAAKLKLLENCRFGAVNIDDPSGEEFFKASKCEKTYTYGIKNECVFRAENIILTKYGSSFTVKGEEFTLKMPGEFNIYNALAAIIVCETMGIGLEFVKKGLAEATAEGRMEIFEKNGVTVLVDYAHNKLSFEAVFDFVDKFYPDSRKICLFGCQGNKALDRRRELPEVAGNRADMVVLTSDDPANEEPMAIIGEVEVELRKTPVKFISIEDREEAVAYAVGNAQSGDVVILAGKGQETTQQVRGKAVAYVGDMKKAKEILK